MSREESHTNQKRRLEIENAAFSATGIIEQSEWFIEGAQWADKTMIDNVCEWLSLNMTDTVYIGCHGQAVLSKVDLIQGVKKAMAE